MWRTGLWAAWVLLVWKKKEALSTCSCLCRCSCLVFLPGHLPMCSQFPLSLCACVISGRITTQLIEGWEIPGAQRTSNCHYILPAPENAFHAGATSPSPCVCTAEIGIHSAENSAFQNNKKKAHFQHRDVTQKENHSCHRVHMYVWVFYGTVGGDCAQGDSGGRQLVQHWSGPVGIPAVHRWALENFTSKCQIDASGQRSEWVTWTFLFSFSSAEVFRFREVKQITPTKSFNPFSF